MPPEHACQAKRHLAVARNQDVNLHAKATVASQARMRSKRSGCTPRRSSTTGARLSANKGLLDQPRRIWKAPTQVSPAIGERLLKLVDSSFWRDRAAISCGRRSRGTSRGNRSPWCRHRGTVDHRTEHLEHVEADAQGSASRSMTGGRRRPHRPLVRRRNIDSIKSQVPDPARTQVDRDDRDHQRANRLPSIHR